MNKTKEKPQSSWIKEAESLFKVGRFEESLSLLEKELEINSNNWEVLNFKSSCLMKLNLLPEAKLHIEKSLKIDDSKGESWGFMGTYYLLNNQNEEAQKCFSQTEKLEGTELSFAQLAYFYYIIEKYDEAILYAQKALSINSINESALNTKGLLLIIDKKYELAIETFNTLIKVNSANSMYYSNIGYAYLSDGNNCEAKAPLEKAISLDPNNAHAFNNLAILYHNKSEQLLAWNYIEQAVSANPNIPKLWVNKGEILIHLIKSGQKSYGNLQNVGTYFFKGNLSVVDAMIALGPSMPEPVLSREERYQVILGMISMDVFFTDTVRECLVPEEHYFNIYRMSLEIVALLGTSDPNELHFAHYTTQETANALVFQNSSFRLNSVTTANDPKEGNSILDFFGFTGLYSPNVHQAFVGSFTFNPDSLNQFRLYGKNNNIEGTGVSLFLSFDYFADNADLNKGLMSPKSTGFSKMKQPLFRCIYIDPISRRVISLGHKEACVFYRDLDNYGLERDALDNKVSDYINFINELRVKVEKSLSDLSDEISILYNKIAKNDDQRNEFFQIIPKLLIHLRYLVKHYDFREEQECRIIQVEPLQKNPHIKVTQDNTRMYVDYLPFHDEDRSYLREVYWGPKTSNFELFKDQITHMGIDILCVKNEHPFV
ncbi:tetratricopeptide repeat protein [Sphingobacterium faecale]|uniref:Tetratricopeptide repeat protein n=1 Tax=Sphingobacterium faecale TaxID=2803775 RepID=A0ABS1R994_9SPHI|nr:tetratricopeptide repeat protein [Sphingobacterium faecale]MBL1411104.1 tetratricopeptide repeat protein [Sphingobacterium faecale]